MSDFGGSLSWLLGLIVLVLLALTGALLNLGARGASRVLGELEVDDGLVEKLAGGLRWPLPGGLGTTNMPPVLVSLELYPWGLRVAARWRLLGLFMPTWYVRYEEILLAEHAHRAVRVSRRGADGVRLRAPLAGGPMIFWTSNWSRLLDLLEARDVAVARRATPTGFWSNH
ncbi:MAG: hypothetical protein ABSG36_01650 [Acidimicrobiales bacterium]|jgi:hypothetical protein